jgi:hypothetical protein
MGNHVIAVMGSCRREIMDDLGARIHEDSKAVLAYWNGNSATAYPKTHQAWMQRVNNEGVRGLLLLLIVLLLTALLVKSAGDGFKIAFIVGLVCAGTSGSNVRMLMQEATQSARLSTVVLGAVAGLVLSLSYVLPQLLSGGVLTLDVWPADKLAWARYQCLSAMLFAFVAGVMNLIGCMMGGSREIVH